VDALYYIGKLYDKEEENNNIITSCVDATSDIGLLKSSDKNIAIKYYLQAAEKVYRIFFFFKRILYIDINIKINLSYYNFFFFKKKLIKFKLNYINSMI